MSKQAIHTQKKSNYIVLPIRRIKKIALACKTYIMIMNFLNDIFLIDVISKIPISVGSGEAIRRPEKIASK